MLSQEYNILIEKLNNFIRTYYNNNIRRGVLLLLLVFLTSSLLIFILEYVEHFSSTVRTWMFYSLLLIYIYIFIRYIILPLLSLFNIRKGLNYMQAAEIISSHFPEIQDKFKNTLELAQLSENTRYSSSLLAASIDQKVQSIKVLPFHLAIDIRINYKYLQGLGLAILIYIGIFLFKPLIIKEGSQRMLHHRTTYAAPAPFRFELLNNTLTIEQGSDIDIKVAVKGSYIPQKIYIAFGSTRLLLNSIDKSTYSYTLKNVNHSTDFRFEADQISSDKYNINVVFPPTVLSFKTEINPPAYTGIKSSLTENAGDLTLPAGSTVKWTFYTSNADSLVFTLNDSLPVKVTKDEKQYSAIYRFLQSSTYSILPVNKQMLSKKPILYTINVIPDIFPSIQADFMNDSSMWGMYYFKGTISDDYGFKKLTFNVKNSNDSSSQISIPIQQSVLNQEFYFAYDFSSLKNNSGNVEYYFEVWDNDGIHGSKSTKTSPKTIKIPDAKELNQMKNEANKSIFNKMQQSEKATGDLQKELKKLQQNVLNSQSVSWEQTQKFQQVLEKEQSLEQLLKQLSQENKQKNSMLNTFTEQDQKILEKQQQVQNLLENIMDADLKKLIDQLKELMKNMDKTKLNESMQDLKMKNEDINKELDRTLDLLKKLDVEEKTNAMIKELEKLSEQQNKLSEQTSQKKASSDSLKSQQQNRQQNQDTKKQDSEQASQKKIPLDSLKSQQQKQQQQFQDMQKQYEELMKQNNQLDEPFLMQSFSKEQDSIQQEFQQGKEELQKNNRKSASKSQKNNSQQLKKLSQHIQDMMNQNEQQEQSENEATLKQTLENVKNLSFTQEDLMLKTKQVKTFDPQYIKIMDLQNRIKGNTKVIEDSLSELAKRTPIIGNEIKKHLKNINTYSDQTIQSLEDRNITQAATKQQFVMTESNELALLLGDMLQQMQQNSQQMCSGGQCKKPGKGKGKGKSKPSYKQMQGMQQNIKQQLQSLINEMKKGQNQQNGQQMSEQLGKMISMQDKMGQMLNEMMQQSGISPESAKKLQEIKNIMNDVQKDIANKNISPQTINHQEQILTRLLEAEKADNERETENKRQSQTGKDDKISNPKEIFQYKGKKSTYDELLYQTNLPLQKFYQELFRKYMINLNK